MTWNDGNGGVFLECETKNNVWLAPDNCHRLIDAGGKTGEGQYSY